MAVPVIGGIGSATEALEPNYRRTQGEAGNRSDPGSSSGVGGAGE